MFTTIDKALIAVIVPLVMNFLPFFGISADMTVGDAVPLIVGTVVTAFFVWLVPNKEV